MASRENRADGSMVVIRSRFLVLASPKSFFCGGCVVAGPGSSIEPTDSDQSATPTVHTPHATSPLRLCLQAGMIFILFIPPRGTKTCGRPDGSLSPIYRGMKIVPVAGKDDSSVNPATSDHVGRITHNCNT